jgi:hypothetical protein
MSTWREFPLNQSDRTGVTMVNEGAGNKSASAKSCIVCPICKASVNADWRCSECYYEFDRDLLISESSDPPAPERFESVDTAGFVAPDGENRADDNGMSSGEATTINDEQVMNGNDVEPFSEESLQYKRLDPESFIDAVRSRNVSLIPGTDKLSELLEDTFYMQKLRDALAAKFKQDHSDVFLVSIAGSFSDLPKPFNMKFKEQVIDWLLKHETYQSYLLLYALLGLITGALVISFLYPEFWGFKQYKLVLFLGFAILILFAKVLPSFRVLKITKRVIQRYFN